MTFDVDALYSTGADNLGRLLAAIETWKAIIGRTRNSA
jgi:hypothetical protein